MYSRVCFSFVALLIISIQCAGQGLKKLAAERLLTRVTSTMMRNAPEEKIEGTPYLATEFVEGDVQSNKGRYSGIPLRYNMYEDQMEFEYNGTIYVLDPAPAIAKVSFANYDFIVGEFDAKGKMKNGFFELLDSGKVTLVARKNVIYKPREEPTAMQYEVKLARYDRLNDVLYYRMATGPFVKAANLKKIIANLPDKKEELTAFVKKEKLSNTDENDIRMLFRYYNSL
jgi:hypothetical protein